MVICCASPDAVVTGTRRGFARSLTGIVTSSTPFSYEAVIRSVSTPWPTFSCRRNEPLCRSRASH